MKRSYIHAKPSRCECGKCKCCLTRFRMSRLRESVYRLREEYEAETARLCALIDLNCPPTSIPSSLSELATIPRKTQTANVGGAE